MGFGRANASIRATRNPSYGRFWGEKCISLHLSLRKCMILQGLAMRFAYAAMQQKNLTFHAATQHSLHKSDGVQTMLTFLLIFAVSLGALMVVRDMDIECAQPRKARKPEAIRGAKGWAIEAILGSR